jgi:hypothetical protein
MKIFKEKQIRWRASKLAATQRSQQLRNQRKPNNPPQHLQCFLNIILKRTFKPIIKTPSKLTANLVLKTQSRREELI